jgi:hypothetical protein
VATVRSQSSRRWAIGSFGGASTTLPLVLSASFFCFSPNCGVLIYVLRSPGPFTAESTRTIWAICVNTLLFVAVPRCAVTPPAADARWPLPIANSGSKEWGRRRKWFAGFKGVLTDRDVASCTAAQLFDDLCLSPSTTEKTRFAATALLTPPVRQCYY